MNTQEEEILHKDRKDQIQKAFKPPTNMTMSTDELSRILESYIAKEREATIETSPSAYKDTGKLILNKPETFLMSKEVETEHDLNNKPEIFLMSNGAEREHNYDQYATGIELDDTSIPQEVHPIDGVKEFKKKIIPLKTQKKNRK